MKFYNINFLNLNLKVSAHLFLKAWMDELDPPFFFSEGTKSFDWQIEFKELTLDNKYQLKNNQVLTIGTTNYYFISWTHSQVELFLHDTEQNSWAWVKSDYKNKKTTVFLHDTINNRFPIRLIKNFFGSRLLNEGWISAHGAALEIKNKGVLVCGASKSGKSSLSFLLMQNRTNRFLSDDLTLINPKDLSMIGWPDRVAIPTDIIKELNPEIISIQSKKLRRKPLTVISRCKSSRGERFAFDREEHRSILKIRHKYKSYLKTIFILQLDKKFKKRPNFIEIDGNDELYKHLNNLNEIRFLMDIVGIFDKSRIIDKWQKKEGHFRRIRIYMVLWGGDVKEASSICSKMEGLVS